MDAAAGEHNRSLGARQELGGGLHVDGIRAHPPTRQAACRRVGVEVGRREGVAAVRDVLADVQQHGPWPPARRHRVGPPDELGNALYALDADRLLDGRAQHRELV